MPQRTARGSRFSRLRHWRLLAAIVLLALEAEPLLAQPPRPVEVPVSSGGVVQGLVTTQNGTIPLGGVLVTLTTPRTTEVLTVMSEGDGSFRFEGLREGSYRVGAAYEGFDELSVATNVEWNRTTAVNLDLRIAAVSERVDVVADAGGGAAGGTLTPGETVTSRELEQLGAVGGLQAALRLLVSVIEVPGGVAIKGGRPSQATVQLGPGTFVDPATGLTQVRLPDDAIDSVTVLPNPYAVEYGRFSSGLVLIQTRKADDRWRARVNNLDPTFRTRRGEPLGITGIASFAPRAEIGGPLVKDRLFLQQAAQYRYRTNDVPSRPQSELKTLHAFSSFTRADAKLSPRHSLVAVGGVFPSRSQQATLGTFIPPPASADLNSDVTTAAVTERSLWSDVLFSETTVEMNHYRTAVVPQGRLAMQVRPETTDGNFYNRQNRETATYQVIETLSGTSQGWGGLHLFKAGFDLLYSRFDATSTSAPILIRRTNGTLARRLDFGPTSHQSIRSTDVALYVQDRVQPGARWYGEFGARLDRDGILGRVNVTPRVGAAFLLDPAGTSVIRGGVGFFYERTPSAAGVFADYENPTEQRFLADGVTPAGPPLLFRHVVAPDLRTSRSLTWDLAFNHRLSADWALHAGAIDRRGRRELIVDPQIDPDSGLGSLRLHSDGRSRYREVEAGVHYTRGTRVDVNVSYVRSLARADLNAFTNFFDAVRAPVLGTNQFARARTDVPHRLLARGRVLPTPRWLLVGVLDWRTGLPYSVVDDMLDFVGTRNSRRFPAYIRTELGIEHRFKIFKLRPWIGVRADNAFSAWLPSDVQANITSPLFGTFYNSEYRQFRVQVRFER